MLEQKKGIFQNVSNLKFDAYIRFSRKFWVEWHLHYGCRSHMTQVIDKTRNQTYPYASIYAWAEIGHFSKGLKFEIWCMYPIQQKIRSRGHLHYGCRSHMTQVIDKTRNQTYPQASINACAEIGHFSKGLKFELWCMYPIQQKILSRMTPSFRL